MGKKLIWLPFSLPGKQGIGTKTQRAAIFLTRWPFWNRRSAVGKSLLCDERYAKQGTDHRKAIFLYLNHRNAIANNLSLCGFVVK